MMYAPEHVTRLWLESKGFFVMGPVGVGHNEIDLLAMRLAPGGCSVAQKVHVEVTVSGRPGGPDDGTTLRDFVLRKFVGRLLKGSGEGNVESKARAILGEGYERWLVLGKMVGSGDPWIDEASNCGVKVVRFETVVAEYITGLVAAPKDEIGRLLDTLRCLGVLVCRP
jgi:hypothetical protein